MHLGFWASMNVYTEGVNFRFFSGSDVTPNPGVGVIPKLLHVPEMVCAFY